MPPWIVSLALLASLAIPARASARADDRVFDLDYWAHPRYIDPGFDLEASLKELERAAAERASRDPTEGEHSEREAGRTR